jgi:superfamily II DNA or RNA helicase
MDEEHIPVNGTENQIKGAAYELQILDLIRQTQPAYLWPHTPETVLVENGIIGSHNTARLKRKEERANPLQQDTGIDIIAMSSEIDCYLVQCKNGYKQGVSMNDLAGFMCWMASLPDKQGAVYYTDRLSLNVRTLPIQDRIKYIREPFDTSYMPVPVSEPSTATTSPTTTSPSPITIVSEPESAESTEPVFKPDPEKLEYQQTAKKAAIEYFSENDNGILSMPCGTGKTFTAFLIAQEFPKVFIASPLKEFAKQNLDRFVEYGYPRLNTLLVDSDGCRDPEKIKKFMRQRAETGFIISATYDSMDVIWKVIDAEYGAMLGSRDLDSEFDETGSEQELESEQGSESEEEYSESEPESESEQESEYETDEAVLGSEIHAVPKILFITDEFHNLSPANIQDEEDDFNKIITMPGIKKLFMSATPRVYDLEDQGETGDYLLGERIYDMSFKYAIERGFITDYRIWVPSIHEDLTDLRADIHKELGIKDVLGSENILYSKAIYLFSCLVNTGSRKCIVYCQDTTEITQLRELITRLNEYYCLNINTSQITSANSANSRREILQGFASSNRIELLFSVRILDECIDIPSCDSIYITYPSKSKIRTIQRLMRCTRTVRDNRFKVGNLFLWCSEYESILETLGGIKEIDEGFADKVIVNSVSQFTESKNFKSRPKAVCDDIAECRKLVIGAREFRIVSWYEKLELVKKYIDENNKRPNKRDKDLRIKILGAWISTQITNYSRQAKIMSYQTMSATWKAFITSPQYSEYFLDNKAAWNNTLAELKTYLDTNKKRPNSMDKDPKIKTLAIWIQNQNRNYAKKKDIMKDPNIYSTWTSFITDMAYSEYFLDNNTIWNNKLSELKTYIDTNNKMPSKRDTNSKNKTLGIWLGRQTKNYAKKKDIMKDPNIYSTWTSFITDMAYSEYFLDNNTIWNNKLSELKTYLDTNKKRPSQTSKDPKIKTLGIWVLNQTRNYSKKINIMKDPTIYERWTEFIYSPQYSVYFVDNNTAWNNSLSELKTYIDMNKIRPSQTSKDPKIKTLGLWCSTQITNYNSKRDIMKNITVYSTWNDFITSAEYSEFFLDNNTVWNNNLSELKTYLDTNKKRPIQQSKDPKIKTLGQWVSAQTTNYNKKKKLMKDPEIYSAWSEFITNPVYSEYFLDNTDVWNNSLSELKTYLDTNKKRPSAGSKDPKTKTLGNWIQNQNRNYAKKKDIMKDPTIYSTWTTFITHPDYKQYFE